MRRFVLVAVAFVVVSAQSQVSFPLFKQCDSKWASNLMGSPSSPGRATICQQGCAMSCVAMALNAYGVDVDNKVATPGTLNAWLVANHGYECLDGDCNNLVLPSIDKLSDGKLSFMSEAEKPSQQDLATALEEHSAVYIAHVHHNGHFVLMTSWNATAQAFNVLDPFYPSTTYAYANISDVIVYNVSEKVRPVSALPSTAVIPEQYPLYKQCDPRWGNDTIVSTTVCAVGCLMSSTSMAIGGKKIAIDGQTSNPGTLNAWLKANGGYTSGNDLEEDVVPKIDPELISWPADAMHTTNDIPMAGIRDMLKAGRPVIANVMHGHHFVLVTGWDTANADTLYINDPGFTRTTYSYSDDVVGWRLFNMTMA